MATSVGSRIFYRRELGIDSRVHELQRPRMRGVVHMRKLAFGALFVGLLAACGGNSGNNKVIKFIDGPAGDGSGPGACNVLTQTGCDVGQKCTWIIDVASP